MGCGCSSKTAAARGTTVRYVVRKPDGTTTGYGSQVEAEAVAAASGGTYLGPTTKAA